MYQKLISLGMIVVCYITIKGQDIRELKSALAVAFLLFLGMFSLYKGEIKRFPNYLAFIFVGFVWLGIMIAPSPGLNLQGVSLGIFWSWKPFSYMLVYLLGIVAIAGHDFSEKEFALILKTLFYVGLGMAIYVGFQYVRIDQIFKLNGQFHEQARLGGFLGHVTFASALIAMLIPIGFYLKQRALSVFMIIIVLLMQSQVAIGGMIVSLLFLLAVKGRRQALIAILLLVACLGVGLKIHQAVPGYISDSNRFTNWKVIAQDINKPIKKDFEATFPLTGLGLGSFKYTYHIRHHNNFWQAHNEYLEILYSNGIIGAILMIMMIAHVFIYNFKRKCYKTMALMSSFLCICVCAGASFVWQLGPTMYATAIIVGLLYNKKEKQYVL